MLCVIAPCIRHAKFCSSNASTPDRPLRLTIVLLCRSLHCTNLLLSSVNEASFLFQKPIVNNSIVEILWGKVNNADDQRLHPIVERFFENIRAFMGEKAIEFLEGWSRVDDAWCHENFGTGCGPEGGIFVQKFDGNHQTIAHALLILRGHMVFRVDGAQPVQELEQVRLSP